VGIYYIRIVILKTGLSPGIKKEVKG